MPCAMIPHCLKVYQLFKNLNFFDFRPLTNYKITCQGWLMDWRLVHCAIILHSRMGFQLIMMLFRKSDWPINNNRLKIQWNTFLNVPFFFLYTESQEYTGQKTPFIDKFYLSAKNLSPFVIRRHENTNLCSIYFFN